MSWKDSSQSWGGASESQQWGGASKQWGSNDSSNAKSSWDANQGKGGKGDKGGKGGKDKSWDQGSNKQEAPAQSWSSQSWGQQDQSWKASSGGGNSWGSQKDAAQSWGKGAADKGGKGAADKGGKSGKDSGQSWGKGDKGAAQSWGKGDKSATIAVDAEELKASLTKFTTEVTTQETMTNPTLEATTKLLENEDVSPVSMKSMIDAMESSQTKLNETKENLTKEVETARKGGAAVAATAQDMAKLLVKCSGMYNQVTEKLGKLKAKITKAEYEAELQAKEAKETAEFKPILAKATADITTAIATVAAVGKQVDPLLAMGEGEELDTKIESIVKAADESLTKCEDARNDLNEKFKAIQDYARESKKNANASLLELQKKLRDRIQACYVYKALKKEFPKLKENSKAVAEATEKLAGLEANISKADKLAQTGKVTAEQVHSIDDALDPVAKAISVANAIIAAKIRGCDAATYEKFEKLRARSDELKKKADAVILKIKAQRDVIKSEEGIAGAKERLAKVQADWKACQDAEMPFLTGVEILPEDVSEGALKACNETSSEATLALSAARSWVSNHLRDGKGYEKELAATTVEALTAIQSKIADLEIKVSKFKVETNDRKITSVLAEVLGSLKVFDKKAKAAEGVGKELASSTLEDETVESITEAIEKTKAALVEANTLSDDVRKAVEAKKKDSKLPNHSPALDKIYAGLKTGQDKLHQLKSKMSAAERLVRTKNAITSGENAITEAEADVVKAQKLVPADGKSFSMEAIAKLDEACNTANKSIKVADNAVYPHVRDATPKCKDVLQKLLDQKKAAAEAVHKIKVDTKERREETLSKHYLEEAETKTKAAETAGEKLDDAEGPFLVGATLSLKSTQDQLAKCKEAAAEVGAAMKAANQYFNEKTGEAKFFGEAGSKKMKEGLAGTSERLKKVSTRLDAFNKDTRERTKDSKVVEAGEKVNEVEDSLKKTLAAAEPFEKEGAEDMSEADAAEPLKVFMDLDQETSKLYNLTKRFVQDSQNEQKGNASQLETLKKLQERVVKVAQDIAEKKKVTAPHETKALGTRLLAESKVQVGGLEDEIKKATAACAPLLEHGGAVYLVTNSVKTLVTALNAHMKAKELTEDALFKEAGGGKKIKADSFVKYLAGLPEAIGHDELNAFSEERRAAIFKKLSADGKYITEGDFKAMFVQKHYCVKAVTVTNQFAVEGSETVLKLEAHSAVLVDILGAPKADETTGCVRAECSVDGKKGWVTLSQENKPSKGDSKADSKGDSKGDFNPKGKGKGKGGGRGRDQGRGKDQGKDNITRFLVVSTPFKQFCYDTDKVLSAANAAVTNAERSLDTRMKQGGEAKDGSRLKECRDDMAKLKEPLGTVHKKMRELLEKFRTARGQYYDKEKAEMQAHVIARNMREAAPFIEAPQSKMEGVEAAAKAEEEAAAPLISLAGEELEKFATPSIVWQNVEKELAVVLEKAAEVREAMKEQQKALGEVKPQTDGTREAQKQLKGITQKLHDVTSKAGKTAGIVRTKCLNLVKSHLEPAAEAIRNHAQEKSLTVDGYFDSLKDGEKLSHKAFSKLLESLGLSISDEHAKLIAQKVEADAISKDAFVKFAVIHYKVLKTIAFTDDFDIAKCKTIRKAEPGVVIEVLEGPKVDEESKMTRIRGRSTIDKKATEGWVTVSGNSGTPFLEKVVKPAAKTEKKEETKEEAKPEKKEEAAKPETNTA